MDKHAPIGEQHRQGLPFAGSASLAQLELGGALGGVAGEMVMPSPATGPAPIADCSCSDRHRGHANGAPLAVRRSSLTFPEPKRPVRFRVGRIATRQQFQEQQETRDQQCKACSRDRTIG